MNSECDNIKEKIADLVSGTLSESQVQAVEQHLETCSSCREYACALKHEDGLLTEFFAEIDTNMTGRQERALNAINRSFVSEQSDSLSIWRIIMKSPITKLGSAAAIIIIAALLSIIFFDRLTTPAYAFEQTVAAMQGKRSFHVQTYYGTPTKRHDEFWAEFDEDGKVIRLRQLDQWRREDNPVETIWVKQIEHQYRPASSEGEPGIHLIQRVGRHEDQSKLEEFDPETILEGFDEEIEKGNATVEVNDTPTQEGHIVVTITQDKYRWFRVLLVDPDTKFVVRIDSYRIGELDDEGNKYDRYINGIEVLTYNAPFDPNLFEPNFGDAMIFDQLSGPVGMAQGDLSAEDAAYEVVRQALEAWAADDYETAGLLFGGAPEEFFATYRTHLKPVGDIVISELRSFEHYGPKFEVTCTYVAEREGERKPVEMTYRVSAEGQPGRWYIDPTQL